MSSKRETFLIDTHAHLTFPELEKDKNAVLERAWEAGLKHIIIVGAGAGLEGNFDALRLAETDKRFYATVGVHPHDAGKIDINKSIKEFKKISSNEKVVAIGEIGLDYYHKHSTVEDQKKCFRRLLEFSFESKLPVVIHSREALKDTLFMLREYRSELSGGVFHCFSGNGDVASEAIELGFLLSIPGVITFKKSEILRKVVKEFPVEKMVVETDCPYLAPEPHRGKRNEPAFVRRVAEEIAKIKGLSFEDVARITTNNALRVFNLPGAIPEGKIVYPIRKSLYINLTNRCTLGCTFCPKRSDNFEVKGHNLRLEKEPSVEDIFRAVGKIHGFEEVVFCGFGEPTLRLEVLKAVARGLRKEGMKIRLDTDGLGSLVHKRNILEELKGLVDSVSVSMNAPTAKDYVKYCPSCHGEMAFGAMVDFLKEAKKYIPEVTATIVTVPGLDIDACKKLAANLGVLFRTRKYQDVG